MPDGTALPVTAIADALAQVERDGEPVALVRDGTTVAVLVSARDAAHWEAMEDALDAAAARDALAEHERTGGAGSVTLEEFAGRLGLTVADLAQLPE